MYSPQGVPFGMVVRQAYRFRNGRAFNFRRLGHHTFSFIVRAPFEGVLVGLTPGVVTSLSEIFQSLAWGPNDDDGDRRVLIQILAY